MVTIAKWGAISLIRVKFVAAICVNIGRQASLDAHCVMYLPSSGFNRWLNTDIELDRDDAW